MTDRPTHRRSVNVGLALVLAAGAVAPATLGTTATAAASERPSFQDTTRKGLPLTPTRPLRFTTEEATWLSLDVSPDGRTILFDLLGDLYTLPMGGGGATRITSGQGFDTQARYSPDGQRIVFVSDRSGSDNVWVADARGVNARQVTDTEWDRYVSPEWTPDAEWIVVTRRTSVRGERPRNDLWLYPQDGGSGVQLTGREPASMSGAGAAAIPTTYVGAAFGDDPRYVWTSATASPGVGWGNWQLCVYDRETGHSYLRSRAPQSAMRPTLSPNGRWLVYATRVGAEGALRLRDLRNGEERSLVTEGQRDEQAFGSEGWSRDLAPGSSFTPDSRFLITSYRGKIIKVDVETGAAKVIPFRAEVDQMMGPLALFNDTVAPDTVRLRMLMRPSPSPDGRSIAFTALNRLWLVDETGGEPRRLTSANHGEHAAAWSPDGRWLAWASWDDSIGGHIWKASADGRGRPQRLTTSPAYYDRLAWSPDGSRLVTVRAPRGERIEAYDAANRHHMVTRELVWLPAAGGKPTLIAPLWPTRIYETGDHYGIPHFTGDPDRVWIYDRAEGLVSMRWDGTDRRVHLKLGNVRASEIIVAPDGGRALALVNQNLYLLELPPRGAEPLVVSLTATPDASVPVRRLSRYAAFFPGWSPDGRRAHWSLGASVFTYEIGAADAAVRDSLRAAAGRNAKRPAYEPRRVEVRLAVPRPATKGVVAFTGARLVTMRGAAVIENGTIVVDGSRIAAVGRAGDVAMPADARVINVTGTTIIPGYVDIHAHMWEPVDVHIEQPWQYLANLAYGVTTTRDPEPWAPYVFAYSDLAAAGGALGPRIFSTGPGIRASEDIRSLEQARDVVRRYSEFWKTKTIKQYVVGDRKVRQWVVMAANEQQVSPTAEGFFDVKMNLTLMLDGYAGLEHSLKIWPLYKDVQELIRQSGITYTPTLMSYASLGFGAADYFVQREPIENNRKLTRLVPKGVVETLRVLGGMWLGDDGLWVGGRWVREDLWPFRYFARDAARIAHTGGRVGMGSHGNLQGLGAHWELWAFAMGGMPPIEIIRTATINGAAAIGLAREIGSIEPGKLADFQVLDRNPLEDIRNSDSIRWVVLSGRIYDGNTLAEVTEPAHAKAPR